MSLRGFNIKYDFIRLFCTNRVKFNTEKNLDKMKKKENFYFCIKREEILEKFRTRRIKMAVTNEYYHRGMDFDFITHVFVWNVRKDAWWRDLYVHMSGRLGRPSKEIPFLQQKGRCITIIDYTDLDKIKELEESLAITFEKL